MQTSNLPLTRRLIILGVLIIVLVTLVFIFGSHDRSYPPTISAATSYKPPITNARLLQNWLPPSVYNYTSARLNDYMNENGISGSSISVRGEVTFDPATYDFDLVVQPGQHVLGTTVTVTNFNSILSTNVTINGQLIVPQVSSQSTNSQGGNVTQYGGFDTLVNKGVSAIQIDETQQAIQNFAPHASSAVIPVATVIPGPYSQTSSSFNFDFSLEIDNNTYKAKLKCFGLAQVELLLFDSSTGKQVFDSGVLSQGV